MAAQETNFNFVSLEIAEKVVKQELSNKDKQLELVEKSLAQVTLN